MKITHFFLILFISLFSCNQRSKENNLEAAKVEKQVVTCIVTSELVGASKSYKPGNIEDTFLTDEEFEKLLDNVVLDSFNFEVSTNYVTHKSFQRNIKISKYCFDDKSKLGEILMNELFVSDFIYDEIKFISFKEMNIFKFGGGKIIEYEIIGGSEYNPHYLTLLLKDQRDSYNGYVIMSDSIRWKKLSDDSIIPLFVERVRINKQYEIPLVFKNQKFNPVGHHKIRDQWNED